VLLCRVCQHPSPRGGRQLLKRNEVKTVSWPFSVTGERTLEKSLSLGGRHSPMFEPAGSLRVVNCARRRVQIEGMLFGVLARRWGASFLAAAEPGVPSMSLPKPFVRLHCMNEPMNAGAHSPFVTQAL
jgi:hypothetical protein